MKKNTEIRKREIDYTNNTDNPININDIINKNTMHYHKSIFKFTIKDFRFSCNSFETYHGLKNIVFDESTNILKIDATTNKKFGINYITIKKNTICIPKCMHGTNVIDIYGQKISGEKLNLMLEPNHTLNLEIIYEF